MLNGATYPPIVIPNGQPLQIPLSFYDCVYTGCFSFNVSYTERKGTCFGNDNHPRPKRPGDVYASISADSIDGPDDNVGLLPQFTP
jgi:hypothetical protein